MKIDRLAGIEPDLPNTNVLEAFQDCDAATRRGIERDNALRLFPGLGRVIARNQ